MYLFIVEIYFLIKILAIKLVLLCYENVYERNKKHIH